MFHIVSHSLIQSINIILFCFLILFYLFNFIVCCSGTRTPSQLHHLPNDCHPSLWGVLGYKYPAADIGRGSVCFLLFFLPWGGDLVLGHIGYEYVFVTLAFWKGCGVMCRVMALCSAVLE